MLPPLWASGFDTPAAIAALDAVVDTVKVDTAAILVDTGTTIPATITTAQNDLDIITGASGVNLLTATQASIDAIEVDTGTTLETTLNAVLALLDDARGEPAQGAPAVNPDAMTKIDYLYKAWRNKATQTATTYSLYDDAGTTVDQKSTDSSDGTTATKGEIVTGL